MPKTTRLDRSNWSSLQHVSGAPTADTKGNVYLDDATGNLYIKRAGGSWSKINYEPLWEKGVWSTGTLTAAETTNAIRINSPYPNFIDTEDSNHITSEKNCLITTNGENGNISLSAFSGISLYCQKNISIQTFDSSPGGAGNVLISANATSGSIEIAGVKGTSIGDNNSSAGDWSLAVGQYTNPWWEGSIFANNDTFGSDYTDSGGQIVSTVLHAETTNSTTQLLFPDASIITVPESKYIYLEFKILVAGVNTSSRAAFSGHLIGRRLETTVTLDSFSINRDSSYDDAMINNPAPVAITDTGFQINVTTTDANPFRWTMVAWGAYTDMYIGT